MASAAGCILSKFYIKPQPAESAKTVCVVVSYRNSTSNHNSDSVSMTGVSVVSYRNSTSNHNSVSDILISTGVVSYRNSTSNHNNARTLSSYDSLYLIEILHQTTTSPLCPCRFRCCILSKFYIKPQPKSATEIEEICCILSKFYIKPQLTRRSSKTHYCCILSKFYIKPQPSQAGAALAVGCILSKFYIKPQHTCCRTWLFGVVSYRNSTSNHNRDINELPRRRVVSYRNSTSNHNVGPHID